MEDGGAEGWLSAEEAGRRLGVSALVVRRLVGSGRLLGDGKPLRIRVADLDEYIESHRLQPGTLAKLQPAVSREREPAAPRLTKAGDRDRRFGPRHRPPA